MALYMCARFVVNRGFDRIAAALNAQGPIRSRYDPTVLFWMARDVVATVPRMGALLACLYLARSAPKPRWKGAPRAALPWLAGMFIFQSAIVLSFYTRSQLPLELVILVTLATVVVGVWEELAFRGLLYGRLRLSRSPVEAALLSSVAFVLFHATASSLAGMLCTFGFGMLACAAYERGAGLWPLAAVHFLVDEWGVFFMGEPRIPGLEWPIAAISVAVGLWAATAMPGPEETPA